METKDKRELKIDDTPAELKSLREIHQEAGKLPLTVLKVRGQEAGTVMIITTYIRNTSEETVRCSDCGHLVCWDKDSYLRDIGLARCALCPDPKPSKSWTSDTKNWISLEGEGNA